MSTPPITAVLFDFHSTLVDQGDAEAWVRDAWTAAGRPGEADQNRDMFDALVAWADVVWERARGIDPENRRDRSPADHREVFGLAAKDVPGLEAVLDDELADALYRTMFDMWVPYDDALPVLDELRARGVSIALLSNVGVDIRPVLDRSGLTERLDATVLSFEVGAVKPEPEIFAHAVKQLGASAEQALMVGDSWSDDGGAAALGIRTLILPRTRGPVHGLDAVLRLVG